MAARSGQFITWWPAIMTEVFQTAINLLELAAATLLILGFVIATSIWAWESLLAKKPNALKHYQRALARTILIGLEVLLAATIVKTVILTPDLESMGRIFIMVALRTFVGWTTSLEPIGHWPWQPTNQ
ncbi:MAG: DUF1622 domain-containing protein [Methyloceanibacter sp.]|jgi:uncharacterized membrane protein